MARTPRWKGSTGMQLAPESPRITHNKEGEAWVVVYNGPWKTLKSNRPNRLKTISGVPAYLLVDTVEIIKSGGGRGTMTITLNAAPEPSVEQNGPSNPNEAVIEIEWNEVSKRLEVNPRYTQGVWELDDDDLDNIEKWRSASSASERTRIYENDLEANATDFVNKLRHGVDSYVEYTPVIRLTTVHSTPPMTGKCGYVDTPPASPVVPSGYQFLKTADRVTKERRSWRRSQEWTGATSIEEDLYPSTLS